MNQVLSGGVRRLPGRRRSDHGKEQPRRHRGRRRAAAAPGPELGPHHTRAASEGGGGRPHWSAAAARSAAPRASMSCAASSGWGRGSNRRRDGHRQRGDWPAGSRPDAHPEGGQPRFALLGVDAVPLSPDPGELSPRRRQVTELGVRPAWQPPRVQRLDLAPVEVGQHGLAAGGAVGGHPGAGAQPDPQWLVAKDEPRSPEERRRADHRRRHWMTAGAGSASS
jgi:hypothetical protein